MDQDSLPEDILQELTQGCGGLEPSSKLRALVARFIRFKHNVGSGPVTTDVLAMLAAVAAEVRADPSLVRNPFADTPWGTPLTVYRMDSKEVLCNGFWMGVGEGLMAHLVKVAMHDDEREAQEFDYRQVRLRNELPVQPAEQGPLVIVPDPVDEQPKAEETVTMVSTDIESQNGAGVVENTDADIEDADVPPQDVKFDSWATVGEGSLVWMEDGGDGEFLGTDPTTGFLKVRVTGKHTGNKFSLYTPDQVRLAEAIPVEHDPVPVGAQ